MPQGLFFVCRVLATKPDKLEYVVFQGSEIAHRNDVEVASKGFATEREAKLVITRLGGVIPAGLSMFLDFWEEDGETVWNWKDTRTGGASQTFKSEQEAPEAWDAKKLVFDSLLE
jgi:hypothetical protein